VGVRLRSTTSFAASPFDEKAFITLYAPVPATKTPAPIAEILIKSRLLVIE
jgi:hypothetical protein